MNRTQINYLNMVRAVAAHFQAYAHLWEGHPALAEALARLHELIRQIDEQALAQATKRPQGLTQTKHAQREHMQALVMQLGIRLQAFAAQREDATLYEAVYFVKSELEKASDTAFLLQCETLRQHAAAHLPELAAYGVTAESLEALALAIEAYRPMGGERDQARGERIRATWQLGELVDAVRAHLRGMDRLVPALVEDAKFQETYRQVRRITNR